MKNLIPFFCILVLCSLLSWPSCTPEATNTLADYLVAGSGKWTITTYQSQVFTNGSFSYEYDHGSGSKTFKSDGSGIFEDSGFQESFNWAYNESANTVSLSDSTGTSTYDVLESTADKQSWERVKEQNISGTMLREVETLEMSKSP